MVGWHHQLNGHSEGQGSLACCSAQGCRVGHDLATAQLPPKVTVKIKCTVSSSALCRGSFNPDKMPLTRSGQGWAFGFCGCLGEIFWRRGRNCYSYLERVN